MTERTDTELYSPETRDLARMEETMWVFPRLGKNLLAAMDAEDAP